MEASSLQVLRHASARRAWVEVKFGEARCAQMDAQNIEGDQ